jgi:hypothetical protein
MNIQTEVQKNPSHGEHCEKAKLSLKLVDKAHCLKIKSEKWDKPGC